MDFKAYIQPCVANLYLACFNLAAYHHTKCCVKNYEKYLQVGVQVVLSFKVISFVIGPVFEIKLYLLSTVLASGFQRFLGALKSSD